VIEAGLVVALAAGVVLFGGTDPALYGPVQAVVLVLAAAALLREGNLKVLPLLWPGLWLTYVLLQLTTLSRAPYATLRQGLQLLVCVSVFFLGLCLFRRRESQERVIRVLVFVAVAEAVYALAQTLMGRSEIVAGVQGTGTYVNRNHFAGLLEMVLPLAVVMGLGTGGGGGREHSTAKRGLFLFLGILLAAGIVTSRSRMGILSALVSLTVLLLVLVGSRRTYSRGAVAVLAVLLASLVLVAWVGLEPVLERFAALEHDLRVEEVGRWAIWKDTVALIREHPLTGTGFGSYDITVTRVQSSHLDRFLNYAHNDYLQLVAELGIVGAGLVLLPILWIFRRTIVRASRGVERTEGKIALGAAGGILALLVHGLTDGNLIIPANAMVFALLLSLGYVNSGLQMT